MRIPKYQMIKNDLKQQLRSGKFENGDKFYTEAELIDIFQVSSITVIRALNDLVTEGYLTRRQGKGTFVSRARKGKRVRFSDVEIFPFDKDDVTVLALVREQDPSILKTLKLGKNEAYYRIERVRRADGTAYIYQKSFIPEKFIDVKNHDMSYYSSIYQHFKAAHDIHLNEESFIETNEVKFPTPEQVATILETSGNEPSILQVRTTFNEETQEIFEHIESYKKWDYYKFKLTSD
ncbi:GntR family transcriptional regulator [Streptococcus moroccensis]|uniref:DNA-binding GntR family transcriptional regulator n=1 Tax=Streptococcus moroccensis TaxID=1451356 RepID=A0ABT9YT81_9STRE|nr:GntR family transcriptional regulator [Streptococcus moroccensis]MDQ0222832.1 DNA-binding GntR family transcriptional regulator [Streptococcus moroccensis]